MTIQMRGVEQKELKQIGYQTSKPKNLSSFYRNFGKRGFDILFVLVAAPLGLTLVLIGAALAMLGGVRPFFVQERVGKDGRVFKLLKIRTMAHNSDELLEAYLQENPEARQQWDRKHKLEDYPRIIRIGNLLRRSSLDEMPQLWNVLKGDMSIVGPRPMMVEQKAIYPGSEYFSLRPGITGPWQISDRSQSSFALRANYDQAYFGKVSLKEDMSILCKTVGAVLQCTGR